MIKNTKMVLLILIIAFFIVVGVLVDGIFYLSEKNEYYDAFEQFCPIYQPDSLWTCTEDNIYFASDENGETLGAAKVEGEIVFFQLRFNKRSINHGFSLSTLDNISYPKKESRGHRFYGSPKFSEDTCTLVYSAADDEEQYFGQREGEVTLTFIKSDLTAPFSFQSEESLNELPFR